MALSRCDADIAGQGAFQSPRQRPAVDRGDDRFVDAVQPPGDAPQPILDFLAGQHGIGIGDEVLNVRFQIGAAAKGLLARSGEDGQFHRVVIAKITPGIPEFLVHFQVNGVHRLGAVEGDVGDFTALFIDHFGHDASPGLRGLRVRSCPGPDFIPPLRHPPRGAGAYPRSPAALKRSRRRRRRPIATSFADPPG